MQIQQNVSNFVDQLKSNPILDGRILKDIAVSTTATEFAHGLGRAPVGYITIKADANVTIYDTTSTTPKSTIKLTASGSATISLWIF